MRSLFPAILMLVSWSVQSATVWDSGFIDFEKTGSSDWTLAENQDFITESVSITRCNNGQLFNITAEGNVCPGHDHDPVPFNSPEGTEWAVGSIADYASLTYTSFIDYGLHDIGGTGWANLSSPSVLHLIDEDIYIAIQFTSWGSGSAGGGSFAYTRATMSAVPVPAAAWFLGSGLVMLGWLRRRI